MIAPLKVGGVITVVGVNVVVLFITTEAESSFLNSIKGVKPVSNKNVLFSVDNSVPLKSNPAILPAEAVISPAIFN